MIPNSVLLDGDELRIATGYEGFTKEDRDKWVLTVAGIAQVLEREGKLPIVCLVSPYAKTRTEARERFSKSFLFYVKGDEENMWPGSVYEEPLAKEHAFKIECPILSKNILAKLVGRQPKKKAFKV